MNGSTVWWSEIMSNLKNVTKYIQCIDFTHVRWQATKGNRLLFVPIRTRTDLDEFVESTRLRRFASTFQSNLDYCRRGYKRWTLYRIERCRFLITISRFSFDNSPKLYRTEIWFWSVYDHGFNTVPLAIMARWNSPFDAGDITWKLTEELPAITWMLRSTS